MSQPHPEQQSCETKRIRESLEKKLFILHTENHRLKSQQEEFESTIEEYVHKIDVFNQKSIAFEQENQELKTQVKTLEGQKERLQRLLKKRNEEYCHLYNYLFTERKTTLQDTFLKEMDLNNRLNEIQHESDNQIIERLKTTVRHKNQELIRTASRVEELNAALVNSAYEYQEQILLLKQENLRLQKMANSGNVVTSIAGVDEVNEYFSRKKIEGLQKEILLYRQELQEIKGKLTEAKSCAASLEVKNEQLTGELQAIRSHTSSYDLSIFSTLSNIKNLEERLASEQEKNRILIEKSAELSARRHEIDDFVRSAAEVKRKQGEISQLKMENQLNAVEINLKTNDIKKHQDNNRWLELQLSSVKIVAASAIDKLKRLLEFYCPYYFKREKLNLYNLTKEQQEFVLESNVEKTLIAVKKQIDQKTKENAELRVKYAEVERTAAFQKEKIILIAQELARKNQEVKTMSETVSSLMERKAQAIGEIIHNEEEGGRNWGYEDIDLQQNEEDGVLEQNSARTRVQILENALQEMQADRSELIDILRGRDAKLIELTAEVNALRNIPNNAFRLHSFNPNQQPIFHSVSEQDSIDDEKFSTETGVTEIREQLRKLSQEFKQERQLLIKQYQRRQAQSISRYSTLLNNFNQLSIKHSHLESSSAKHAEAPPNNQEQHQQMNNQPQAEPTHTAPEISHLQSDQSAISESAIQNFTDILKKYEREFNKYVAIYQTQIKKTLESVEGANQQTGEVVEGEQIQRLQSLIAQHCETTKHLENLLLEKEKSAEMQIKQLENSINQRKKTAADLSDRLDAANSTISQLRSQVLEQRTKLDFGSQESANSTFTLLNLKNKEIDSLKRLHSKLKHSYQEQAKELARLKDLPQVRSEYESEQLRALRQLASEQGLLGVLQGVLERLRD